MICSGPDSQVPGTDQLRLEQRTVHSEQGAVPGMEETVWRYVDA